MKWAKVVAAPRGEELIQFLAALAIYHYDDLKKRMKSDIFTLFWCNLNYSSNCPGAKYLARQGL